MISYSQEAPKESLGLRDTVFWSPWLLKSQLGRCHNLSSPTFKCEAVSDTQLCLADVRNHTGWR